MKLFLAMAGALALCSCGGDPTGCDFSNIYGTYKVSLSEKSGTCGDVGDFNVFLQGGDEQAPAGCVVNGYTHNEAECTGDSDVDCDDARDGLHFREIGHLVAEPDGSSMKGSITFTYYRLAGGALACSSTYDVKYTHL